MEVTGVVQCSRTHRQTLPAISDMLHYAGELVPRRVQVPTPDQVLLAVSLGHQRLQAPHKMTGGGAQQSFAFLSHTKVPLPQHTAGAGSKNYN